MTEENHNTLGKNKKTTPSCVQWLVLKLRLTEEGATPPNWKYIWLVFAALFSSASTLTFLFPFLPEMMLTLGYSENQKGTYAGLVASSVFAGRTVGSLFWGWLSDRSGRKVVFLITIALNGVFAGLFGFSRNLIMAMLFRFLCGAVNGTVGTAKAVLYDISDNSNQAVSMSMLSISWGLGMVVGPALGGLLADPAKKWPILFSPHGLFGEYPYLLPSLFPSCACFGIFFIILFKFDDTFVGTAKRRLSQEVTVSDSAPGDESKLSPQQTTQGSYTPLLTASRPHPHNNNTSIYLGQSVNSLHVEAESTAFFAQEMLQKKHNASPGVSSGDKYLRSHVSFVSVPDLAVPGAREAGDPSETIFLSTPDITALKSHNKRRRPVPSGAKKRNAKKSPACKTSSYDPVIHDMNGKGTVFNDIDGTVEIIVCPIDKAPPRADLVESKESEDDETPTPCNRLDEHNTQEELCLDDMSAVEVGEDDENVCRCIELCCSSRCCFSCRNSSLFRLLRLANVWASTMLYVMFSFICIGVEDIFPVFASTRKDYGGLGFSTDEIGMAIGTTFLPLLFIQIKLYPFLVSKMGIRKVFLMCAIICMFSCQMMPVVRLLNNHPVWLWTYLMVVQIPFKISTNCCFAGTALLINNSVTPDFAGQANGLAMMATAIGRTMAPAIAGSLFSWSVTYGPEIGVPFDTSFPFFVLGSLFLVTVVECLQLDPSLDRQRK